MPGTKGKILRQVVFYGVLLASWQALISLRIWPEYLFPSPRQVFSTIGSGVRDFSLLIGIGTSMRRILIGYVLSILIGGLLGLLISRFRWIEETVGGLVLGLQTLPSVCWLPLSLLWFGLNERAMIFVVLMGALFSITLAVVSGLKSVPVLYMRAGTNMGARRGWLFLHVMLPAALPSIISGLKQGWSFAWRSLMAAELLFVSLGLGQLLMMGRELNDMAQVIAVMLVITLISVLIDRLVFGGIERRIRSHWGLQGRR